MTDIPHYLPKVLVKQINTNTRPGRIYHINVFHDDWCDHLNLRGLCNCNPEVDDPVEDSNYPRPKMEANSQYKSGGVRLFQEARRRVKRGPVLEGVQGGSFPLVLAQSVTRRNLTLRKDK